VTQAVYNGPVDSVELRTIDYSKRLSDHARVRPESTRFGGKFVGGSVQKSFVHHELLNWTRFVEQKLYLEDYYDDSRIESWKANGTRICQKGYIHISPCHRNTTYVPLGIRHIPRPFLRHLFASANDPVYEMKIDGKPFANLLQLRAAKIKNFLRIPAMWDVAGFAVIKYETLVTDIESLLRRVGSTVSQKNRCSKTPLPFQKTPYHLPDSFRQWIRYQTDWSIDKLVGYMHQNNEQRNLQKETHHHMGGKNYRA
jgi:hypothetical protein